MRKQARARLSPLRLIPPLGVCGLIGVFTDQIAGRAGISPGLAVVVSVVIGLLWFIFLFSRLLD